MVHVHVDKWDANQQFCISDIGLCACRVRLCEKLRNGKKKANETVGMIRE